ncbi:MAG TPA: ion channel [Acetobacteraceae bacterium]|nr:ion channel [Acetobacteraceae bacterium]
MSLRPHEYAAQVRIGEYAVIKKGISRFDLRDPYHVAVSLTWPQFFAALLGLYLTVNLVFAALYTLVPGSISYARPGSFVDAFFFSFETLATVGYGEMFPHGVYGHLISCAEIVSGLAFTAILTGLTFVRFSRPRAKFVLAQELVVTNYNGAPTLMLRVGNGRVTVLSDARAKLNVLLSETTAEGSSFRRAHELKLQRAHIPVFPLTWTIMHTIDERSPLHGFDAESIIASDARFFFSLEARDPQLSATVYELKSYPPVAVRFGMRYADAVTNAPNGTPIADMSRVSVLEPDTDGATTPIVGWSTPEDETVEAGEA